MNPEEYWERTRKKWVRHVTDPLGGLVDRCGFCVFAIDPKYNESDCRRCPVTKVYGGNCLGTVKSVQTYYDMRDTGMLGTMEIEESSALAKAVVQELDNKKDELVAAMYEILRKVN